MKKKLSFLISIIIVITVFCLNIITASAISYKTSVETGKYYSITNLGSGKLLNVYGNKKANNTNVTIYKCDRSSGQNFKFEKKGSNYVITPQCATNSALNVYGSSAKNNSNVCIWNKTGHSTQSWIIEYNSKINGFIIRSANNKNFVLTATGSANSSNVCLKKYDTNNKYQIWKSNAFKVTINRNAIDNTSTKDSKSKSKLSFPVTSRRITSNFQPYYRQDYKNNYSHVGVDYVSTTNNKSIFSIYDGKVTNTGYNGSVGYYVEIKHSYNRKTFYSYYFHLKKNSILVKKNTNVTTGQKIATMGTTGDSSGVHLHFQVTNSSVLNSNGTIHTPRNNSSYKNWSQSKQSEVTSFKSNRGIVFYNPEILFTKGFEIIK